MLRLSLILSLSLWSLPVQALSDSKGAQAELATWSSLYGLSLGFWISAELDASPRPTAWIMASLTGAALYGGWKSAEALELSHGQAHFITSTTLWLTIDSALIMVIADADEEAAIWSLFGIAALSAVGTSQMAPQLDLNVGQVLLVDSVGLWSSLSGGLLAVLFRLDEHETVLSTITLFNLLGLGSAYWLSQRYDPSVEQVQYLNLGAFLGGLGAGLIELMIQVTLEPDMETALPSALLLGIVGGAWYMVERTGLDKRREAPAGETQELMFPLWQGSF